MHRPAPLRRVVGALIASVIAGALAVTGFAMPAAAVGTHSLTVSVRSIAGTPLTGITLVAIAVADGRETMADLLPDGSYPRATAVTGKPGFYTFAALADIDHTLYFSTKSTTTFSQLLGGASDIARAEVVPAAQETLSVSLATNAVISGTVKSASAVALYKAYVSAYRYTGSEWELYSTVRTDSYGKYKLTDIDPGSYRLKFEGNGGTYSPMYSGGGASLDGATAYSVGVGSATTVNAAFPKGTGSISGYAKVDYQGYEGYGYFGMAKAHAFAIPVTVAAEYPNARSYDYGAQVASAATGTSGAYSIKNLRPGTYMVKVVPWYYNQSSVFVGASVPEYARIVTVVAGKTSSGNTAYSHQTDGGAALTVRVWGYNNSMRVPNADVLVQSDVYPDYFFSGKTDALGTVTFGVQGADLTMQPGSYTVTVTSSGTYAPYTSSLVVHQSQNYFDTYLRPPVLAAGFVAAPSIAETSVAVGTHYVVSAQPKRTTAILSYQWMRDGRPIWGAIDSAYASQDGDIGTQLSVHVSSYQFGYPVDEADVAVAGLVVSDDSVPTVTTSPSLTPSEEAHVGTTLRVLPGKWSVRGLTYSFQWLRDGIPFENEGDTYVVALGDLDSEITAVVTASKQGHPDATAVTASGITPVFAAAVVPRSGVVVTSSKSGVATGSLKFTAKPGTWTALAPTFTYEWWRAGVKIADGATLVEKQTSSNLSKTLEVRVSATAPGFGDGSAIAVAHRASLALQRTEAPVATLVGDTAPLSAASSVMFGGTVRVSTGVWEHGADDVGNVTYAYKWLRKLGTASANYISGATAATYTPAVSDIGAALSVKVTASSPRWASSSVTVAVGTVIGLDDLTSSVSSIQLAGPAEMSAPLYAPGVGPWQSAGATVTYQWYGCAPSTCSATALPTKFAKITGATGIYLYVNPAYAGGRLFVTVTAKKAGSQTAQLSTPPLPVAPLNEITVLSNPTISPSRTPIAVNVYLNSYSGTFSNSPTITTDWEVCFSDCLTPDAEWVSATGVRGAYNGSFTPALSMWGTGTSYLRIAQTASKTGYASVTAYSDPMAIASGDLSGIATSGSYSSLQNAGTNSWNIAPGGVSLPPGISVGVRWYVENELRSTSNAFSVGSEDDGKLVYVVRTFSGAAYNEYSIVTRVRAGATGLVTEKPVSIVGNRVGDTLSLTDNFPWTVPDNDWAQWQVSYSWLAGGWYSGSAPTYTVIPRDVGWGVRVTMTLTSPLYGTVTRQVYLGDVINGALIQQGAALDLDAPLTISWDGDLLPGSTMSSSALAYSVAGVTSAYKWQWSTDGLEWTDIAGATSPTYAVALIDSKRQLRLVVTATKAGHATVVYMSDPAQVLEGPVIRVLGAPILTGAPRVGSTLTTTTGAWSEGATVRIQWVLNGRPIPGATGTTYVPLPTNAGDEISVRVTGSQTGRLDVVAETSAVTIAKGVAPTVVTAPVITGTTTLTTTPGVWSVSGLTFTYEWTLDDDVVGTTDTFVLLPATVKADYTLKVRATRYGYQVGEYVTP